MDGVVTGTRVSDDRRDAMKSALVEIIGRTVPLRKAGHELIGLCPFHNERTPSFSVVPTKGFYFCHGCGAHGDTADFLMAIRPGMTYAQAVEAAIGADPAPRATARSLPPPPPAWRPVPCHDAPPLIGPDGQTVPIYNPKRDTTARYRPVHVAVYRDAEGGPLGYVLRCERDGRKFTPQVTFAVPPGTTPGTPGRWCLAPMQEPRPFYGLDRLAHNLEAVVLIVMGEKKCDQYQALLGDDAVAISWAGGDQGRSHTDFSPLAGRHVIIWPDNDESGITAALGAPRKPGAAQLSHQAGAASIEIVSIPQDINLPRGWDVGDAIAEGWNAAKIADFVETNVTPWHPPVEITAPTASDEPPPPSDPPAAASDEGQPDPQPIVKVIAGKITAAIDELEAIAMRSAIPLYQRGGVVVRPGRKPARPQSDEIPVLQPCDVNSRALGEIFSSIAIIQKFDGRLNAYKRSDCPPVVTDTYLSRAGQFRLPVLTAIINAPTLRRDGSILDKPGYDPATGVLFDPDGTEWPPIYASPDREAALVALETLQGLLHTFDFVPLPDAPDLIPGRSVALSAIMTAVVRQTALPTAPLHSFSATTRGSGKSMLADLAALIATGRMVPAMTMGDKQEEFEKRLTGALLAGDPIIGIDNVEREVGGDLLCAVLTQTVLHLRPLGTSEMRTVPSNALIMVTGNNMTLSGDMTRRSLQCYLDPKCEEPEKRKFSFDPIEAVKRNRARYVSAVLTILRAYVIAGKPSPGTQLGSFIEWSNLIRGALVWLGECDPVLTMEAIKGSDPETEKLSAVLSEWHMHIGFKGKSISEAIECATSYDMIGGKPDYFRPSFREALLSVAGEGGAVNGRRLGKYLSRNRGRILNGLKFVQQGIKHSTVIWAVEGASCD